MGLITRGYRLRAYPNGAQRRLLDHWFGATRWLWNTALEIRSEAYRSCGLSLTGNDLSRWVTQWKRTAGHEWLAEVPATALTQCLRDQGRAFKRPWLPIVQRSVGVDVGLTHLVSLKYLRQQQRCLARRQKGSHRREKQRVRVARAHARLRHARAYALHALSTRLVRDFDLICLEDLNVTGLARGRAARAIQDAAFSELRRQLTYKAQWYGRVLVAVDRWYQLAGCDDRDLRVDAGDACPEEHILVQVLADEARSGHANRAGLEPTRLQ